MRLKIALLATSLLLSIIVNAQEVENTDKPASSISRPSRDFFMLQFNYEGWANKPDSIQSGGFNRGANFYLCYDFPIPKSNFSFAAGIGVGTANIYFNNQQLILSDTGALGSQVRFVPEQLDYKKFKLTTAYLEAPLELRFFGNRENRNKGFKAAIGLRVGTLIGAHTKGRRTVEGNKFIDKENTKRYLESYRFAGTLRLGWGNFSLMGTYNLNNLYKKGAGPQVTPFSFGICISGL